MKTDSYLAIDLGATSGRTVLATFDGTRIQMREFTRFDNPQITLGGHIFWDLPYLYNQIIKALCQAKAEDVELTSIGIDTWGCDIVPFGQDGQLLGLPYCYRDPHTDGAVERFCADRLSRQELYQRTGIQFMPFNTLFQLDTLQRSGCVAVRHASQLLFIPDALVFLLTGQAVCEYTVASTSQMLNAQTCDFDPDILSALGLSRKQFGRMVFPGEQVGVLTPQVQAATGLGAIPVIAVGSHDTASAVASVPALDSSYAYLSCGTWSLLGIESPRPIITPESYSSNFTNEGGLDGSIRFLKNITGLWLFEQCRREWASASSPCVPEDVNALNALCLTSRCQSLIAPDDPAFAHPASMTAAIREHLRQTNQPLPQTPADYIRVIFRSLAARYREVVDTLRAIAPVDIQRLHVIGGGSRNEFLMQFAADALQMPVIAGPQEGTALGNAAVQLRASGQVRTLPQLRQIICQSIDLKTYQPNNL